jgi:hypothetical protein
MKIHNGVAATLVAMSLVLPGAAVAGLKVPIEVRVNTAISFAHGALGTARNSKDSMQDIGCAISSTVGQPYTSGSCWAFDASGNIGQCSYFDRPQLDKAVASISNDSYIQFTWNDKGECTKINVMNGSLYEPKGR